MLTVLVLGVQGINPPSGPQEQDASQEPVGKEAVLWSSILVSSTFTPALFYQYPLKALSSPTHMCPC